MIKIVPWILTFLIVIAICGLQAEGAEVNKDAPVNPEVPRITAYEAKKLYDQGKLILANAHESGAPFEKTRLIGAISMPNGEVQSTNPQLPKDLIVAFYCV